MGGVTFSLTSKYGNPYLCQEKTKKWWTIFCVTNFQKEPTNNLKEGLPLSHALTPFSGIALTIEERWGFVTGFIKGGCFNNSF